MKCLLDMDGVITDFIGAINKVHRKENPFDDPKNRGVYAVEKLWKMTAKEFWKPADSMEFWEGLEKTPEADWIVDIVIGRFGLNNVAILTAPSLFDGCMAAKKRWMERHYPLLAKRIIFCAAGVKEFLAGPNKVLVDDRDSNIIEFQKAGGVGVLVPRPWNVRHEHSGEVVKILKEELDEIFSRNLAV